MSVASLRSFSFGLSERNWRTGILIRSANCSCFRSRLRSRFDLCEFKSVRTFGDSSREKRGN